MSKRVKLFTFFFESLALNEQEKKALFVEVKWKELSKREAKRILKDLKRKSKLVVLEDWEGRFGIVAKHIKNREKLREEGYLAWDLKNFGLDDQ